MSVFLARRTYRLASESGHFNLLDDSVKVDVESADVADVPLNHHACCVLPVQVGSWNAVEELAAQAIIGVKKDSNKFVSTSELVLYAVLTLVVIKMDQTHVLREDLDAVNGFKLFDVSLLGDFR